MKNKSLINWHSPHDKLPNHNDAVFILLDTGYSNFYPAIFKNYDVEDGKFFVIVGECYDIGRPEFIKDEDKKYWMDAEKTTPWFKPDFWCLYEEINPYNK